MAKEFSFKLNRKGVAELQASRGVSNELERRAKKVRDAAESAAPRDSGRLSDSHRVEVDRSPGGRARARVINDAPYAAVLAASGRNWLATAMEAARG